MDEFFSPWPYDYMAEEDEDFNRYLQGLLSKRLEENHPIINEVLDDKEVENGREEGIEY